MQSSVFLFLILIFLLQDDRRTSPSAEELTWNWNPRDAKCIQQRWTALRLHHDHHRRHPLYTLRLDSGEYLWTLNLASHCSGVP